MACSGQVESHIPLVMEAREKMRDSENDALSRSARLHLLDDAGNLIRQAMKLVGKIPTLREMHLECTARFLKV